MKLRKTKLIPRAKGFNFAEVYIVCTKKGSEIFCDGRKKVYPKAKEESMETRSICRKEMSVLILGILIFCLFAGFAHAQVVYENEGENWVSEWNGGPGNTADYIFAVDYGADGNIYTAGQLYMATGGYDFVVISLTPAGDTNWVNTYNGTGNGDDGANAIVYGADNYIYAAGYSEGSGTAAKDFIVIKYDTLGNQIWVSRYNGSGYPYEDEANAIVYGNDGYVYAAGLLSNAGPCNNKFGVIKYRTSDGNRQWVWNEPTSSSDEATSIAYGSDGYIYAAGYYWNNYLCVQKFNTSGTRQWNHKYGQSGRLNSIVYGNDGYIYSAGTRGGDFIAISIDPATGDSNWVYTYDGPGHGDDEAYSLVKGPGPALYAAGYSTDTTGGGGKDYTIICLVSFAEGWVYRYNGPGNGDDCAYSIDINNSGSFIYAAGTSEGDGTMGDITVTKHGSMSGDVPNWIYRYNSGNRDECRGVVYGTDGNIYAVGASGWGGSGSDFTAISLSEDFPPTIPELISPVDSTWFNDTTVSNYWHKCQDPESPSLTYQLEFSMDPMFATYDSFVVSDTTDNNTLLDTFWYWRVKARNGSGRFSDYSDIWSFGFDLTAPTIPTLMSPIMDVFVLDTSVTFDWGDVTFRDFPTLIHYVIQIDTDDSFPAPIVDDTLTQSTSNYILVPDDRYYWRVKAYDLASNESDYTNAESFRLDMSPSLIDSTTDWDNTPSTGPFSVYSKVVDIFGVDSVFLYFKRMEDPVWFPVEMIKGSGNLYFEEIPGVGMANDTVKYYIYTKDNAGRLSTDPEDAPTNYYWFVAGYDPGVMDFNTPTVFSFGLRNNPTKGKALFNLALPEAADISLCIYDATGRLIDKVISGRQAAGYYEIPWSKDVSSGIFFYHLESPWKTENGKLVLVR